MSKTWLLANDSEIIDAAVWDGVSEWTPPNGLAALDPDSLPEGTWIGATLVDGAWVMPAEELPAMPQQPEEPMGPSVPERDYGAEIDALDARVTMLEARVLALEGK